MFLDLKYSVIFTWCYCIFVFVTAWGRGGGGVAERASGTLSNYNVKIKGNNVQTMRSFVLVTKNNEAVLVIKPSAAPNNKMTCAQSED